MSIKQSTKARVVQFESCWCGSPSEPHLLVTHGEVDLKPGEAVAISYAWGEYHRNSRIVGHHGDGTIATMQLGLEWSPKDFIATLADICENATYCWLDQFCVSQNKDEISRTLARIPQVYRTFEVIVLMPGKLCECHDEGAQEDFSWSFGSTDCPNNLAYGPWFSRLWTRQEFLYASKISVRWITSGRYQCPGRYRMEAMGLAKRSYISRSLLYANQGPKYPRHMLSPVVQLYLQTYINDIVTKSEAAENRGVRTDLRDLFPKAMRDLHNKSALARRSAQWTLEERQDLRDCNDKSPSVAQFLRVNVMKTNRGENNMLSTSLHGFVRRLYMRRRSHRATSQPRDYVLAVWPDCPRYKVPEQSMSLAELLEDAISQMEKNFGVSIAVSIPAGILGSDSCSGLWRPRGYLNEVKVTMASDVYGMVKRLLFPYEMSSEGCARLLLTTNLPQRFINLAYFSNIQIAEGIDHFSNIQVPERIDHFKTAEDFDDNSSGGTHPYKTVEDFDNDPFAQSLAIMAIYADVWGATEPGERLDVLGETPSSERFQFMVQDIMLRNEVEKLNTETDDLKDGIEESKNEIEAAEETPLYAVSEYSRTFSNTLNEEFRKFLSTVMDNWNSAALSEVASAVLVPRPSFPLNKMPYLDEVMGFLKDVIDLSLHHDDGRSSWNPVARSKMQLRLQQWRELRKTLPETIVASELKPRWLGGDHINYHDILWHVACIALAVPFHTAHAAGLQLMVDCGDWHGHLARVGLARKDFNIGLDNRNTHTIGAFCSEDDISDDYHLGEGLQSPMTGMYEAIEVDDAGNMIPKDNAEQESEQSKKEGKSRARKRKFKIIGAWIPPRIYPRLSMTAIIQPNVNKDPSLDAEIL